LQRKHAFDCAHERFRALHGIGGDLRIDLRTAVVRLCAERLAATQGARKIPVDLPGLDRVLPEGRDERLVFHGEAFLRNSAAQQRGARDVEHGVISAVDRAVRIAIVEFEARAAQSPLTLARQVARERRGRH
jgi:hypothetical protein